MSENCWALKCLICGGFSRCSLVPMQEHAMHTHCRTRDDLRAAQRREVPGGYVWTFPDGVDWLGAQKANVIIRGWSDSVLVFEDGIYLETVSVDRVTTGPLIFEMVERHVAVLGAVHMIEFEFPELPESERFFRFGSDRTAMVQPAVVTHSENSEKPGRLAGCPRCGGLADRVTDPRASDRLVCRDCGLAYVPDEWLREFYGGVKPK